MPTSIQTLLKVFDCVALRRTDKYEYQLISETSDWLDAVFTRQQGQLLLTEQDACIFLADFLIDAEEFWDKGAEGTLRSGIWTEERQLNSNQLTHLHLEASAATFDGEKLLIIKNLELYYKEKQATLQKARELESSNEALIKQHDYVKERLDALLQDSRNLQDVLDMVSAAINNANLGVLITDVKMVPTIQNPSLNELFEVDRNAEPSNKSAKILFTLIDQQFPEFERMINTKRNYEGELYWLNTPYFMKWLKLSMHPIRNGKNKVTHWLFLLSDVTRIKHLQQQNQQLALYDRLTELPNRQFFWQMLDNMTSLDAPFYILYIDINRFKYINDVYGHTAGDELLATLTERFSAVIKKKDILARIGGDEFALILYGISDYKECQHVAKELIATASDPITTDTLNEVRISVSLGAASYPSDARAVECLMKYADLAAFHAKNSNKNSICFFSDELQQKVYHRIEMENALRLAIENGEFQLFFQPMLDVQSGEVLKAETLLRWPVGNDRWISPADFIPIAEESGLIIPLGRWVFHQACIYLKRLEDLGFNVRISINLSPKQFNDKRLTEFINDTLKLTQANPKAIELEITEGVLISDFEKMQHSLDNFKNRGISISIDDFGTGYSSLAYLKKLPIDNLKIDRSFVKDVVTDDNDKTIVLAIIAMAHQLRLDVVAEGVETSEQQQFLEHNQCDTIQGFVFSRPSNFEDFCQFLRDKFN